MKARVVGPFCCLPCGPRTRVPRSDGIEWQVADLFPFFVFHVAGHMDDER